MILLSQRREMGSASRHAGHGQSSSRYREGVMTGNGASDDVHWSGTFPVGEAMQQL